MVEDTRRFYRRAMGAVAATWRPRNGGEVQVAMVYLDMPDEDTGLQINFVDRQSVMSYSAADLQGLDVDECVEIDGVKYRVRTSPRGIGDGADMTAMLGRYDDPPS